MTDMIRMDSGEATALTELKGHVDLVLRAMKEVMRPNEDYGVIPGTQRPTLLQPGAQKLAVLFRLAPEYVITPRDLGGGHIEYLVQCRLLHQGTGNFIGSGIGSCSSMESKYRWRGGAFTCPDCGKEAIIKGKAEYGGGWLCWGKKGGCGAKFPESQFTGTPERKENEDISDCLNTVLKMAQKRALVSAITTCTAASDLFTQDMEEAHAVAPAPYEPPPAQKPQQPSKPAARKKSDNTYANAKDAIVKATTEGELTHLGGLLDERRAEGKITTAEHAELVSLVMTGIENIQKTQTI